jgi:hypothetical protein
MIEANFLQVVDYLDEEFIYETEEGERIFALIGRDTRKLFGLKIETKEGKIRHISFGEIDNMKRTIERM